MSLSILTLSARGVVNIALRKAPCRAGRSEARHGGLFLAENKQKADPSLRSVESHPTTPLFREALRQGICCCEKKIRSRFLALPCTIRCGASLSRNDRLG